MRICIFTHNLKNDNGGGVLSRRLMRGLRERLGAEIIMFTAVASGEPFEQAILRPGVFAFLRAFPTIRSVIKTCDVIHAFDAHPYGAVAALASLGLRKPIIITAVGTGSVRHLYHPHWLLTPLTKWAFKQATVVTAISRFTKDLITKHLPALAITVINPGVDPALFDPGTDTDRRADRNVQVRDSAGTLHTIGSLQPYLLSVGSVRWRKGYKRSLKAFALVRQQFPQLRYVIVGRSHWKKYFQELLGIIDALNLGGSVVFFDKVNDAATLQALYRNAELFCLLSQNWGYDVEGFGMVFLEAAAAGLAVVGSAGSGVEDAVENGKNGFLVDWQDKKGELAEKIILLLRDERLRTEMSQASLAWASTFGWDKRIGEYVELYEKLQNGVYTKGV